jgi:RNA polymerase sigma factor (sigma-70 family)
MHRGPSGPDRQHVLRDLAHCPGDGFFNRREKNSEGIGDKRAMKEMSSDAELLVRSVGDPPVFAALYERHGQTVRRYVARRVGSEAGEDLAAEVFVRAFRARERYRAERDSALPWLLGVANHVITGHRRSELRRLKALQRLAVAAPQLIEREDYGLGADLVRELRRLSGDDRDALLLVVWGELTYEEVAVALDVPIGTVSSRVARARRKLAAVTELRGHRSRFDEHDPSAATV